MNFDAYAVIAFVRQHAAHWRNSEIAYLRGRDEHGARDCRLKAAVLDKLAGDFEQQYETEVQQFGRWMHRTDPPGQIPC